MAIEIINVGTSANDGTGDALRDAFIKCNDNFDELETTKIEGTGTDNYIARFNGPDAIENGSIFDNGNLGVGTTNPLGILHLYKSGATTRMVVDGDAGQSKIITYRTGGLQRFGMYVNNTSESGSNVGSDFQIRAYNDAGSLLSTPFFIKRSTGNVGIGTSSPSGKLDVFSTSDVYQNIITSGSGTSSVLSMYNTTGNTDGAAIGYNGAMRFGTITGVNAGGFSERMRITSSGNVGIGTTSPNFQTSGRVVVDINGSSSSLLGLSIGGNSTSYIATFSSGTEIASITNPLFFTVNGAIRMTAKSSGFINIANLGTGLVYSNAGDLTSTNPSDERLKNNITDLNYGLNEILQLRPVTYNWKNDTINQGKQFGFIAQEVQQIMPDLITEFNTIENDEEVIRLGLDKEAIFVAMVNAIKELKTEIEILKTK